MPWAAERGRDAGSRSGRDDRVGRLARLLVGAVLTGIVAGLGGVLLLSLLHLVQHLAFGYTEESFLAGIEQASALRRIVALTIGGTVVGIGWWIHRRIVRSTVSVTHALHSGTARMAIGPVASDGALQVVAVGAGASLGREGAPRELGAAFGGRIGSWLGVPLADRRLLLAAGAGAGLAAVYSVPLSGTVFALEALLLTVRPRAVVVAALSSASATATTYALLGREQTYRLPALELSPVLVAAAVVVGVLAALTAQPFRASMTHARTHAPRGWRSAVAIPVAFAATGVLAIAYPEILGNGKALAQDLFSSPAPAALAAGFVIAKPTATWLCLRAGAIGGLLTPAFATGAALGALVAALWGMGDGGSETAELALMGAAAFLAVAQHIPVTAGLLALEFTHVGLAFVPLLALAVAVSWLVGRGARRMHPLSWPRVARVRAAVGARRHTADRPAAADQPDDADPASGTGTPGRA